MKVNSLVYASDREARTRWLKSYNHLDRSTFGKPAPTRSRHLKVQLRKPIVESDRNFPFLFNKILDEPGADPWVDSFEKVCNLRSRELNILGLEDLGKSKGKAWIIFGAGQRVRPTSKAMF